MLRTTLVLVLAAAAAACTGKSEATKPEAGVDPLVKVALATVEKLPAPERLTLTGMVMPKEESDLTATVAGKVLTVRVDRGQRVKFGDPILQVDVTNAALSAQSIKAQLNAAQAQEQLAAGECKRSAALFEKGAITKSQFDRDTTSCTATSQTVAATRAQLQLAFKSVADGVVRAPFDGVISDRWISPGEWVGPGVKLVTLVDDDPLHVDLSVPEAWVPRVKLDQAVQVKAVAFPDQGFPARVTRLGAEIGRMNRALTAEAELAPGSPLRPGMFAEATITLDLAPMAVVPATALVKRGNTWRLFVVVKGHLEERVVQRGPDLDGGKVALLRGANPGDKVAATIDEQVVDGVKVE